MSQPSEPPVSEPVLDRFRQEQARKLARARRYLAILDIILSGALLLVLSFTGLSKSLVTLINVPVIPQAILYFIFLMIVYRLLLAPLSYCRGYVTGHRYGLSTQSLGGWLADELKATGLTLVLGSAVVAVLYWFIASFPAFWWLLGWGALILLSIVLTNLAPVLIVPLFFKMKPLTDPDLTQRLEQLAQRAGTKVKGTYTIELSSKGTTANAALMGLGNTKRIVLSDTLLQKYTPVEIEVIMAHEMGHHAHNDILRLMVVQSSVWLVVFYLGDLILKSSVMVLGFRGISDVAAFPWLVLVFAALSLLIVPLFNTYSRHVETQADEYALRLSGDPASFTTAMAKLTDQNLAEAQPGRWAQVLLHSHPSYHQRLEHARNYARNKVG